MDVKQEDILISPHKTIRRFQNLIAKYGQNATLTSNKFQKERELWISAVFALAVSEMTKRKYWLRANLIPQDTPDVFMTSHRNPAKGELGVMREIVNLEIMEYESHAETTIAEHIINKKLNKNYPKEYALVCYIHSRYGEDFKLIDVIEPLRNEQIGVGEIWILFNTIAQKDTEYTATRVYPEPALASNVDYSKHLDNPTQQDFLKETRGMCKKVDYERLGTVYVPLP